MDQHTDQHEANQREWADPANWSWGVYNSPHDTRVWVPKRPKWMGMTLNFAHRAAVWWLVALLLPGVIVAILCVAVASR